MARGTAGKSENMWKKIQGYSKSISIAGLLVTGGLFTAFYAPHIWSARTQFVAPKEMTADMHPVVILGGGVGGLTSALYLSLANMPTLVVEGGTAGGLLTQSTSVRNWPGEIDVPGSVITDKLRAQVVRAGAEIVEETLQYVDFSVWPYKITLSPNNDPETKRTIQALSIIVAIGANSNYLGVPGEKEYWGKGVSNCAVCDGALYREKNVCVIGGGDSAIEEARYLADIADHVTIFVRSGSLKARDKRKDDVISRPNVTIEYYREVSEILGNSRGVSGIEVRNTQTGEKEERPCDGVFLAIGFTPNTKIFGGQLALTDAGYIKLGNDQETSMSGIYAVGDIADPVYKQAITAAGSGCRAALQAHEFVQATGYTVPGKDARVTEPAEGEGTAENVKASEPAGSDASGVTISVEKGSDKKSPADVMARHEASQSFNQNASKSENTLDVKSTKETGKKSDDAVAIPLATADDGVVISLESADAFSDLVEKSTIPVVIDFSATWCGPCRAMEPVIKKLAVEFAGKARFVKIDIDKHRALAGRFNVRGVPSFVFMKDGIVKGEQIGAIPATEIRSELAKLL